MTLLQINFHKKKQLIEGVPALNQQRFPQTKNHETRNINGRNGNEPRLNKVAHTRVEMLLLMNILCRFFAYFKYVNFYCLQLLRNEF